MLRVHVYKHVTPPETPEDDYYDEGAAILVERMSTSPSVAAFARDVASKVPKVAAPR